MPSAARERFSSAGFSRGFLFAVFMFLHYLLLREVPLGVIVERMPVHFGVTPGINLQPPETREGG